MNRLSDLLFVIARVLVRTVMVGGRILLRDGRLELRRPDTKAESRE